MARKPQAPDRSPGEPSQAEQEGEISRKIWLAGIGAYGRAIADAQDSLSKFGSGTSKFFEDLVKNGEKIEQRIDSQRHEMSARLESSTEAFQSRVKEMRDKLKRRVSWADDERLTDIETRLARIEALLDASPAAPSAAKRPAGRATRTAKNARGSE